MFVSVIVFGMVMAVLFLRDEPIYLSSVLVAQASGGLAAIITTTNAYAKKSTVEHRLQNSILIAQMIESGEISPQSVYYSMYLSQDSNVTITGVSPYGGITQADSTQFMAAQSPIDIPQGQDEA